MRVGLIQLTILAATVIGALAQFPCYNGSDSSRFYSYGSSGSRCDKYYLCTEQGNRTEETCGINTFVYKKLATSCHHMERDYLTRCGYCQTPQERHPYGNACDVHYQCTNEPETELVPRCCPAGQRFDQTLRQCVPGACTAMNYSHPLSCRSYYRCNDGNLETLCCGAGRRFHIDQCIVDNRENSSWCDRPCVGDTTEQVCTTEAVANDPCSYKLQGATTAQKCAGGLGWNSEVCTCTLNSQCPATTTTGADYEACKGYSATLNNTTAGPYSITGATHWTRNVGVIGDVFSSDAYLEIYHYSSNFKAPILVRLSVQVSDATDEQVLLSNDCPDAPDNGTLTLTINPSSRTVRVLSRRNGNQYEVVSKTWTSSFPTTSGNQWIQVTLRIGNGTASLDLRVTGTGSPSERLFTGEINAGCPLYIGGNPADSRPGFSGKIRTINIYTKKPEPCIDVPPVDFQ